MSTKTEPLSVLVGTQQEELRWLIREHARIQEGYDAHLYDLWEEWNDAFFEGQLVPPLIQLTDPGHTHRYGCCSPYSGLAGLRSSIKIRRSILEGTCLELKHGSRNKKGCRRFLEDVLLHEMIHQWQYEITGPATGSLDAPYSGHGPAFSAKANEIGSKLGFSLVGRTCKKRDHEAKGLPSPSQWPHNVRPAPLEYYLGAYVPTEAVRTSKDKSLALTDHIKALADRYGVEEVYAAALTLQVEEWEREELR